jgi:hypothetical protein
VADRKVTQLPAATSADLVSATLLHVVNTAQSQPEDRNRKATLSQFKTALVVDGLALQSSVDAINDQSIHPFLLMGA